jgi:integrase
MITPLPIPKNRSIKGLFIYCNYCKSILNNRCKTTHGSSQHCPHAETHVFKAVFYVPGTKRTKTRILDTRDINEAIIQTIEFEQYLKENQYEVQYSGEKFRKPQLLVDCMGLYLDYLNNVNVPAHRQKIRSKGHLNEVERYFRYFFDCLKESKIECKSLMVNEVDDKLLGLFHSYLLDVKKYNNTSFNKVITIMKSFYNFLIEEEGYNFKNPFRRMNYRPVRLAVETITKEEYVRLLEIIEEDKGKQVLSTGENKYHYFPWLKFSIQLGLLTGRRRDEIINFKYSDIECGSDGEMLLLESEDQKVNKAKGNISEESKKLIYIPLTGTLKKLIIENGYEKYKGTASYLLAPEKISNRETLKNQMSKGFSHFYKLLETDRQLTFKCLRKTYITRLALSLGLNARVVTRHSGDDVLIKHYLDEKVLSKVAENFEVF